MPLITIDSCYGYTRALSICYPNSYSPIGGGELNASSGSFHGSSRVEQKRHTTSCERNTSYACSE